MKIAIVGGSYHNWNKTPNAIRKVRTIVEDILKKAVQEYKKNLTFISGGCSGVDKWAEAVARSMDIRCIILKPEIYSWVGVNGKKGYMERNIEIARLCDELYCIEPVERSHSGGMWTYKLAKTLYKKSKMVIVK